MSFDAAMRALIPALLLLVACGTPPSSAPDSGVPEVPECACVPNENDGGTDAGTEGGADAGAGDAGYDAGVADGGPLTAVVYARVGSANDSTATPQGPGLILMGGGTDVDDAFIWAHQTIAGATTTRVGDVVVVRSTGANAYDSYIYGLANFNSVQTVRLPYPPTLTDLQTAAALVNKAEVVFFAGGNQAHYVAWKDSPLEAAINGVYARGGVVGGTSAGEAILGDYVFDAVALGTGSLVTSDVLANPYHSGVSFTRDFLKLGHLGHVVTDSHFVARDRFGRLAGFMARQIADGVVSGTPPRVIGIGVDERAAIVVDKSGVGRLKLFGTGGTAYIVRGGAAAQCAPNQPLEYPNLTVTRLDATTQYYDFTKECGTGPTFTMTVSGTAANAYSVNPYTVNAAAGTCP